MSEPTMGVPYCLHCERLGHISDDCWATHSVNARSQEIDRLRALASLPSNPEHDTYGAPPVGAEKPWTQKTALEQAPSLVIELDDAAERITRYSNSPLDGLLSSAARAIEALADMRSEANSGILIDALKAAIKVGSTDEWVSIRRELRDDLVAALSTPAPSEAVKGVSTAESDYRVCSECRNPLGSSACVHWVRLPEPMKPEVRDALAGAPASAYFYPECSGEPKDCPDTSASFESWFQAVEAGDGDIPLQEPKDGKRWDDYVQRHALALGAWQAALASPPPATTEPRPLDDPRLQQLFGDTIWGAYAKGLRNIDPPPEGHWLTRWWAWGASKAPEPAVAVQAEPEAVSRLGKTIERNRKVTPAGENCAVIVGLNDLEALHRLALAAHPKPAAPATADEAVSDAEIDATAVAVGWHPDNARKCDLRTFARAILALRSGASAQPAGGAK